MRIKKEELMGRLIIDGNKVYEIDEKCLEKKRREEYDRKREDRDKENQNRRNRNHKGNWKKERKRYFS